MEALEVGATMPPVAQVEPVDGQLLALLAIASWPRRFEDGQWVAMVEAGGSRTNSTDEEAMVGREAMPSLRKI